MSGDWNRILAIAVFALLGVAIGLIGIWIWRQNRRDKEAFERELERTKDISDDDL